MHVELNENDYINQSEQISQGNYITYINDDGKNGIGGNDREIC